MAVKTVSKAKSSAKVGRLPRAVYENALAQVVARKVQFERDLFKTYTEMERRHRQEREALQSQRYENSNAVMELIRKEAIKAGSIAVDDAGNLWRITRVGVEKLYEYESRCAADEFSAEVLYSGLRLNKKTKLPSSKTEERIFGRLEYAD